MRESSEGRPIATVKRENYSFRRPNSFDANSTANPMNFRINLTRSYTVHFCRGQYAFMGSTFKILWWLQVQQQVCIQGHCCNRKWACEISAQHNYTTATLCPIHRPLYNDADATKLSRRRCEHTRRQS